MLEFELVAFDPITKKNKLRVLYHTRDEIWRFVTEVPGSLYYEKGNFFKLLWQPKDAKFSIYINGVDIVENESI